MQNNLTLPADGLLRLEDVLKFIPLGKTSWYDGIKAGIYPKPGKLGKINVWHVQDVRGVIEKVRAKNQGQPLQIAAQ